MDDQEIEYIKSCASLLQHSSDHAQIIEILERLQTVSISIETLKSTRIGIIVNKLTKRNDLPTNIQTFAWRLVNEWKEIATASARKEKYESEIPSLQPIPSQQPPSNHTNTASHRRRRKRSLSTMLDNNQSSSTSSSTSSTTTNSHNNSNNNNNNKRQRVNTINRNTNNNSQSMFASIGGDKKSVPSLQQICIRVMKQNAMQIGKLPCELDGNLVKQIYGSLKPSELKKIYKLNPHLKKHLDILWRRQLINLNPNYVKKDKKMSWFKAYQIYLIERKDKLESAKRSLAIKTEQAKCDKQKATIFNKEEATAFKQRIHRFNKLKKCRVSSSLSKRNRMMKDCMDFVNRRNRMFTAAAIKANHNKQTSYNKKQSFVKRQKEIRNKRQADKNRLCNW